MHVPAEEGMLPCMHTAAVQVPTYTHSAQCRLVLFSSKSSQAWLKKAQRQSEVQSSSTLEHREEQLYSAWIVRDVYKTSRVEEQQGNDWSLPLSVLKLEISRCSDRVQNR